MRIKALIIAVCVALFATTAHGQVQLSAITDEWAASGTEFDAIKMNVTNTASAAGSDLLDLQIGGTTYFGVKKTGEIRTPLDSVGLLFGAGGDATLWYDGTDVLLDARAVGTGDLIVKGDLMPHADSTYTLGTTGVRYSDGFVDAFTIGGALTSVGTITVGVDDTGYDVKFFGASAGAFSLYDESADTLIIRGPTAAGPGLLNLSTGELTNVDGGVLGRINFQAPLDSAGTDAILVAASIWGEADATFSASVNTTDLVFALGTSEAAVEQFRMTAAGNFNLTTGDIILPEKADHTATPAAGKMQLWTKNTVPTTLMATDDAGRDYAISDEGVFNVKAYGAVGDGSTDDSTAIQACIDAAEAAGGGTVLFPDGLDFVTDGHTIDGGNNVTLRSDGYATLTFASAGLTITSDNITIENLHLDGDATIATCVTVSDNATDTRIANCKIGNVSGTNAAGVLISGDGSDRTIVENCHIYDVIGATTGRGIRLVGNTTPATGIRGVKLVNNYITNIQPLADGDGIVVQDWTDNCDVLIQGNTFIQCEKRGVKLQSPGCTVIGNYFEMADVGADTPLTAIDVQTQNTRVIGNIITGYTSDHFINIGSTSAGFEGDNVIVSGNQLLPTAGHGEAGLDMIQINGGTGITITDNQILGGDFRFAVDTNGSSAEILIQGNIFDGGSSNSIQVADTGKILTNTVITNNKFLNVGGFVVTDGGLGAFGNNVVYDQTNVTDGSESSPTSGDGIHRTPGSKEVTTTDATVTTLELVDTANDAVYHAEAIVMATETAAHDEMASYHIAGTFRNDGGTLTQVGATTVIHSAEDTVGWDCDFDVNADDIRLRVTGAAATNVNWRGRITWDKSD